MSLLVLPFGNSGDIVIPANESIAVACQGTAQVSRKLGFPNYPDQVSLIGTVINGQSVFGPYASGATIIVEAVGGVTAFYEVGTSPQVQQGRLISGVQAAPVDIADGGSMAYTTASILGGLVTATPSAGRNIQLPTGAAMDLASTFAINDFFDWSVITLAAFALTTTAGASGHTLVGSGATAATSGSAARFRTRKTAADTFVTYRIG
ncbi:hypothetical protein UFOVP670_50 [uncultured Caudovirales phage]|uniref:Uncharacterized protein n=1 Tax=uncultured Caudovirales phage TaxID=2100421 RepID=A0A6J5NA87_9CAUD|nr:hypothetical protein UFOVP670_50 [uncultured Caudovirales phage]